MGRLDEALAAHDRALRYRQDYATAHFNRGNVLKALGRPADAIAARNAAFGFNPARRPLHQASVKPLTGGITAARV